MAHTIISVKLSNAGAEVSRLLQRKVTWQITFLISTEALSCHGKIMTQGMNKSTWLQWSYHAQVTAGCV